LPVRSASASRGARVIATSGIRKTLAWDHGKSIDANYRAAAQTLADSLNWEGEMLAGETPIIEVFGSLTKIEMKLGPQINGDEFKRTKT
jgi:hypothetical protein